MPDLYETDNLSDMKQQMTLFSNEFHNFLLLLS